MGVNADYVARMKAQLKQWDTELDALAARSEGASAEGQAACKERIVELRAGREAAQKTLHQMRAAGEAAGAHMKASMEAAWKTIEKALQRASSSLGA